MLVRLHVTNHGQWVALGPTVSDTWAFDLSFIGPIDVCEAITDADVVVVTCTFPGLAVNKTADIVLELGTVPGLTGALTNAALIRSQALDSLSVDNDLVTAVLAPTADSP